MANRIANPDLPLPEYVIGYIAKQRLLRGTTKILTELDLSIFDHVLGYVSQGGVIAPDCFNACKAGHFLPMIHAVESARGIVQVAGVAEE